ncbi:MAG TPA: hypothetical protein VIV60_03895 [Polyangiaceae bacterium]
MQRILRAVLCVSLLAVIAGCQQKNESATSATESSSKAPVGKVEKAVANAVSSGAPAAAANSGPPADGILEPARAETEAPSGQPPKLTIGSTGAEPRMALRANKPSLPRALKIEVTLQGGDQGLPPIEMALSLESKAAAAKAPDDAAAPSKAATAIARIRDIKVMMPNAPAEFVAQLSGLKASKVTFSLTQEGAGYGFTGELSANAKPELRDLLDTVIEGLSLLTLPVPHEKVGTGAFWMVASRDKSAGFGLVSYHMVKLSRADDKTAEFEFDSRRYAIGRLVDPALLPPGASNVSLKEFSAGVKGHSRLSFDSAMPTALDAQAMLRGALSSGEGAPGQTVQSGTSYRITVSK